MIRFLMAKKKNFRPKGPIQILASIGLVIAILWTAKGLFQFGSAGYKEVTNSKSNINASRKQEVTLNCVFTSGKHIQSTGIVDMPKGMQGTQDIQIVLDVQNRKIIKFETFLGFEADIRSFNDSNIIWTKDHPKAAWNYNLSRLSGNLQVQFYEKRSRNEPLIYNYNCSQSQQRF